VEPLDLQLMLAIVVTQKVLKNSAARIVATPAAAGI
jgi:hypothetical protein